MTLVVAITAGASSLQVVSARAVSTRQHWSPDTRFLDTGTKEAAVIGTFLAALFVLASPVFAQAIRVDLWVLIVIALFIPVQMVESLTLGRIQGRGSVTMVAGIGLGLAALKVVSAVVALTLGGEARSLIVILLLINVALVVLIAPTGRKSGGVRSSLRAKWIVVLVVAQTSYWALASLDIFIARVVLPAEEAGQFAAAATLAKAVLFVPGLIALVTLPWAGRLYQESAARLRVGLITLSTSAVAGFITVLGVAAIGPWVLTNLLGSDYTAGGFLLLPLALAYFPIGVTGVLLQFHFTSERSKYALTTLLTFLLAAISIAIGPPRPLFFVAVMGVAGSILFVALFLEIILERVQRSNSADV